MKHAKKLLALVLSVLMLLSVLPVSASAEEEAASTSFAVVSSTDIHGKCWDTNVLNDTKVSNSLLNISTAVKSIRETYGDNVILIDNGDLYQGTPVSSYNLNLYTQGKTEDINPCAIALAEIGYDVFTIGNHEFNYAWDTMNAMYDYLTDNGVSFICANLYYEETGERVFTPYIVKTLTLGGQEFKVAIIGIENTDCTRWDVPDNYPGIIFSSPENPSLDIAYEVQKVQQEMADDGVEADFTILAYHAGLGADNDTLTYGTNTENQVLRTIKRTTGIDMVVAGHDHSTSYSNNKYQNADGEDVLVVNAGGSTLTESVFTATYADGEFSVTLDTSENLTLSKYAVDTDLKALIQPYAEAALTYVNTSVGTLTGEWDGYNGSLYLQQSDTIDLINRTQVWAGNLYLNEKFESVDALNEYLKGIYGEDTTKQYSGDKIEVDMSSTSVVTTTVPTAGELSMKNIYGFYKYDNSLYIITMTGQEIKDLLEYNASKRLTARVSNGEVTYGTTGDSFTNPVFYGLNFTYDMYQAEGERVVIEGFSNGKAFDLNETYIFAINNYHLGNAGNDELGKYATTDAIWSQTDDLGGGYVQDLIADYVGELTERDGGVYPTADCAKNGENPTTWSLSYSGDLSKLELSDNVAYIAKEITETDEETALPVLNEGDTVILYNDKAGGSVGIEEGYNGRASVTGTVADTTLYAENGTAVFTVGIADGGYTFYCSEGYLSSSGRNNLGFSEALNANCVWAIEVSSGGAGGGGTPPDGGTGGDIGGGTGGGTPPGGMEEASGWMLKNTANNVYLESYSGAFTTYSGKGAAYMFKFYQPETFAKKIAAADLADGDQLVIYYNAGGAVLAGASGNKLAGTTASPVDTKTGSIMAVPGEATVFTVEITSAEDAERVEFALKAEAGYLTAGPTGNSLSFAEELSDCGKWYLTEVEGGYHVMNVGANYNGNYNQALEFYSGFTTYGVKNSEAYLFNLYRLGVPEIAEPVEPEGYYLPVFETSDIHGYLLDISSGDASTYQYRLASIADDVNDTRADAGEDSTILLDSGDIYQGNVVSNLENGEPLVAAFDIMGYDAVGIGNHEYDWDIENTVDADATMPAYSVGEYEGDSEVPVVNMNTYENGEKVTYAKDYVILDKVATDKDGNTVNVKIGVIGYATNYATDIMYANFTGAGREIKSMIADVEALAVKLETELDCDATIVLTHGAATEVANALESSTVVDLVCGGHTHNNMSGEGSTTYMQPANQASAYAYTELLFETDDSGEVTGVSTYNTQIVSVTSNTAALYDTEANAEELDADIVALSKAAVSGVQDVLDEKLGFVTVSVDKGGINGNRNCSVAGNWMSDLMARSVGADIAFTNGGGIRTSFPLEEGENYQWITAGDIYTISPFCNMIYVYELTASEMLETLSYALNGARSLGLQMSGVVCYYTDGTITTLVKDGEVIYNNGEWAEGYADKTFKVATNEYVATSSGTPFSEWNSTDKLVDNSVVDNEGAIAVLKAESEANDSYLYVDTTAHFIEGTYTEEEHEHSYTQITIAPTCVDDGATYDICEACGDYTVSAAVAALGHDYVDGVCSRCGAEEPKDACEGYTDIDRSSWYHTAADFVIERGIMGSTKTDALTFEPGTACTRAMIVSILYRLSGSPEVEYEAKFSDVAEGKWFTDAVIWAAQAGIVSGYTNGKFGPNDKITREQMAVILKGYADFCGKDTSKTTDLSIFPDGEKATWSKDYVSWAVAEGLISGKVQGDKTVLDPQGNATRAEVASILMRFIQNIIEK